MFFGSLACKNSCLFYFFIGLRSLQDLAHFQTLNCVKSSTVATEKSSKSAEDEFLSEDDDFFDEFLDDIDEGRN